MLAHSSPVSFPMRIGYRIERRTGWDPDDLVILDAIKAANVGLRFLLELGVVGAVGYWGYRVGKTRLVKIGLAIGLPVVAAAVWITFGAPGAALQLQDPAHLVLEMVLFGAASLALARATRLWVGLAFAAIFVMSRALMYVWGQ